MADNGNNEYGVTFGRIMFLQRIIEGHTNVVAFKRHDDLAFDVERIEQRDTIQLVCVDQYVLSEALARQIVSDFPEVDIIFVGGKWNHSTTPASEFCQSKKVGIYNAGNINAGLLKTKYW